MSAKIQIETNAAPAWAINDEFRFLAEHTVDGVLIFDASNKIKYVSPAYLKQMGYVDAATLLQKHETISEVVHPDDYFSLCSKIRTAIKSTQSDLFYSYRVNHANGQPFWREASVRLKYDGAGKYVGACFICRDITTRVQEKEQLRITAAAFESPQGLMVTDANRVILRVNRAFTEITGYSAEEVLGQDPRILSSGRHHAAFYTTMWTSIAITGSWQGEIWNRHKNGDEYPEWRCINVVKNDADLTTHYVSTFFDISNRKNAEKKIQSLLFYDPLTGLPNRRFLMSKLEEALAASLRRQHNGALLFIDLDNFKIINDTIGHTHGDVLLQQVAQRLSDCVCKGDTVARLGGDEFVVILEGLSSSVLDAVAQAEAVGKKIIAAVQKPFQLANCDQHSSCSMGITIFGEAIETIDEPLKRGDLALYQAKAAGRNTLRFFDPEMQSFVTARATMAAYLREAVLNNQFVLYYQAQVSSKHQITGVEALVRWQHPQRGIVSPGEFIPLAEETGLILPLGHWVLSTACRQLAQWSTVAETAQLTIAVNVSARQFSQPDFVDQVLEILDRTGANAHRLKLELTESVMVSNVEDIINKMTALKAHGVGFSLDDFGTGYSSLSYLKRLPLDQLKIDQGFVRDILVDANDAAIAKMVIVLAESMGLMSIAEGVESEAQRNLLASLGCHAYQGYLFGKPMPADEFEQLLERNMADKSGHCSPT